MDNVIKLCQSYPQILIFLALAAGYFLGKVKIFGLNLGSTASVLLVALVLGQANVSVPEPLPSIGFALFMFAIGYKIGPSFSSALRKEGLHYIWLALSVSITALLTAIALGRYFGFDAGTAAGMLSGAMTQSAILGTADGAIEGLATSAAQKSLLLSNVAIAYAITYIFGTAGRILFFKLTPGLMRLDLKSGAKKLEEQMSGGKAEPESPDLFSWYKNVDLRAYRLNAAGKTVSEIEALFKVEVVIEKIRRGEQLLDPTPELLLTPGDELALAGGHGAFVDAEKKIGPEVDDGALENIMGEMMNICVLKKEVIGKTLGEISREIGHGIFLRRLIRQGDELPLTRDTVVHKCDILSVAGSQTDVEKFIKKIGYPERPTATSDLIMVGLGIVLGTLIGLITVPVFNIPVTMGVGGGVLVAGLVSGWLRTVHPTFGQIPTSAQWIFTDVGLNLFIACVGLNAAPKALHAVMSTGGSVFIAGVALSLVPMIAGVLFGLWVLRLNPVLLFGALTGAGTISAALNSLKEDADSAAPALAFAVPFAINNVVLTIWGAVIVHIFFK